MKPKLYKIYIGNEGAFRVVSDSPIDAINAAKNMYIKIMRKDYPSYSEERADYDFRSLEAISDIDNITSNIKVCAGCGKEIRVTKIFCGDCKNEKLYE